MSNKIIGIVGWKVGDNSFGATIAYMEWLAMFGEVLVLPPSSDIFQVDALVLPGGTDTLSSNYGRVPSFYNSNPDVMKEFFFKNNLEEYIKKGTPIFGICLGMQMLNVAFGGELTQNCYHPYSDKSRSEKVHECNLTNEFMYLKGKLKLGKEFKVNSLHHQGVGLADDLSKEFKPVATFDTEVEAFIHKKLPIAGVQWHPEELGDALAIHLFSKILDNESKATTGVDETEDIAAV